MKTEFVQNDFNIQKKFRLDIEGLRAISIISVVFFHYHFPFFGGGFVGVDIFFVISGYLITRHLYSEIEKTNNLSFSSFYARRIIRLLPAALTVIFITVLGWFIFLFGIPEETKFFEQSVRYALLGLANIYFYNSTGGYFDQSSDELPLHHFWSLGVEEQFYFVWPLLLFTFFKLTSKKLFSKYIFLFLLLIIFLSFYFSELTISAGQENKAFYLMPLRAWELGAGAILVFLETFFKKIHFSLTSVLSFIASITGIFLIGYSIIFFNENIIFPGRSALIPVLGAFAILLAGSLQPKYLVGSLLSLKPFVLVGRYSYGWYLWHWPFLSIYKVWNLGQAPSTFVSICFVTLSFLLAAISYNWIEAPFRNRKFSFLKSNSKIFLNAFKAVAISFFIIVGFKVVEKVIVRKSILFQNIKLSSEYFLHCTGKMDHIFSKDCMKSFPPLKNVPPHSLVIWGNSHARTFFAMFEEIQKQSGGNLYLNLMPGGPPGLLYGQVFFYQNKKITFDFTIFHQKVFSEINDRIQKGEHLSVVLASRWPTGVMPISINDKAIFLSQNKTEEESLKVIKNALQMTIIKLNEIGVKKIMIILPFLEFEYRTLRVNSRHAKKGEISKEKFFKYRLKIMTLIEEITKNYSNIRLIDPALSACGPQVCHQFFKFKEKTIATVFDDDHPSIDFVQYYANKHKNELEWIIE